MVVLVDGPENLAFGSVIGTLASGAHLPGISVYPEFVDGGGLMSYGPDMNSLYVGAADYVEYLDHLQVHPDEFTALFNTILINVTGFFREHAD